MELSSLLLTPVLILFCFLYYKKVSPSKNSNSSTVLRSYLLIGNFPHFIRNRHRVLEWVTELVAASLTNTVTVSPVIFTANPSNVEYMLKTNFDNYPKGDRLASDVRDFLGHGIFNIDGEQWKVQRKTASFEFNTKSIRIFTMESVYRKAVDSLIPLLKQASLHGSVLDLQDVLERFAFDNICSLVLGKDPKCLTGGSDEGAKFYDAFEEAAHLSVERTLHGLPLLWKLKKWLNVGSERRLKESMSIVHAFIDGSVRSGREGARTTPQVSDDFLSRFAEDSNNSEELLRDILISFVLAGRDTTPAALSWFFWIVSSRPDIIQMIQEELKSIRQRHENYDNNFTLEELREMHYLHAAISEVLRLYPPAPLLPRTCWEDDVLPDGTQVRKGWLVMYSSYAMGRLESIWGKDCMEIKPERWLEKGVFQPKSSFRYTVFHAGPRMCLGKEMAYIQMKAVAACILERFQIEVVEKRGEHQIVMTMKIKGGLPVRVKEKEWGCDID